jgi:hypothetical protein
VQQIGIQLEFAGSLVNQCLVLGRQCGLTTGAGTVFSPPAGWRAVVAAQVAPRPGVVASSSAALALLPDSWLF